MSTACSTRNKLARRRGDMRNVMPHGNNAAAQNHCMVTEATAKAYTISHVCKGCLPVHTCKKRNGIRRFASAPYDMWGGPRRLQCLPWKHVAAQSTACDRHLSATYLYVGRGTPMPHKAAQNNGPAPPPHASPACTALCRHDAGTKRWCLSRWRLWHGKVCSSFMRPSLWHICTVMQKPPPSW